jgi:hypothetical protein
MFSFAPRSTSAHLCVSRLTTIDVTGSDGRRIAGEDVPEICVGTRSRRLGRWLPAMVVALGFTAFAPACLAQVPVASNPTPVSFGSQAVGSAQAQTTVTFTVTTGGTLDTTPLVLTTGAPNLDYKLGTGSTCTGSVSAGTCTVNVVFTPKAPGRRLGAVVLTSGGATVATALLNGTGTGPAVVFPGNPTILPLGSGFGLPAGVAVDGAGNVYVADQGNNAVKEIVAVGGSIPASNPTIRTLGSGFSSPRSVAVDGAGNVYVADQFNNAVKEIVAVGGSIPASNPTIRTLGSGFNGPFGVAVDGVGNVYVADEGNNAVKEIVAVGGSIPASNPTIRTLGSGFNGPFGVAVDGAGNVYVADDGNNAVKEIVAVVGRIPASNPTINTLGSGFNGPFGVAVDGAGNVYVADQFNSAVKEIVAVGGSIPASNPTILTLGSGFSFPTGVAVDGAGNVYVADENHSLVKEIPLATPPSLSFASTSVGNATATQTLLLQNIGNANLMFPIPGSGANPSLSANYTLSNSSTCPQLTPSTFAAQTLAPGTCTAVISFTPVMPLTTAGSLTFIDNSVTSASQTVALTGTATGATGATPQTITFPQPTSPAQAGTTATLTATASSNLSITYSVVSGPATLSGATVTYTGGGTVVLEADQFGNSTYAQAAAVQQTVTVQDGVGVSGGTQTATVTIANGGTLGTIYVLTTGQPNLDYTFVPGGTCTTSTSYMPNTTCTVNYNFTAKAPGQRLGAVQLVATDNATILGTALLTGTGTGAAVVFPGNAATTTLGSGFIGPFGVAVDGAGNVYVAEAFNSAVKEIMAVGGSIPASNPTIRTLGSSCFSEPAGVAVDGAGNVYVADAGSNLVQEIIAVGGSIPASNPTILTLGSGFSSPAGVTVDGAGNVYVADAFNNLVKEIMAVGGSIPASNPTILTLGSGFRGPAGVSVDGAGNVYVADAFNNLVKEIMAVGGSIPASNPTILTLGSGFSEPAGVAVDGAGNVYVADTNNNAVKEIVAVGGSIPPSNPTILTLGSGFSFPRGVAVDGAGNVYVAESGNNAVREIVAMGGSIPASPTILTLGSGFSLPHGVAVDGAGNVYVGDFFNNAVKEIPLATPPSLSFASTIVGGTSSPQTLLLQNIGNAALSFPAPGTGTSISAGFTLGGASTCPQVASGGTAGSLASGTCTNLISFTPTAAGSISGALVFMDNSLSAGNNGMQSVPLSGTATAPVVATQATASTTLTQNHAATSFTPVTGSGGTGTLSYSVSPTLPTALTYSLSTGAITGTPTVTSSATTYTVTVTDANSATTTATFSLTVNAAVVATQAVASTRLTVNKAATSFTPVTGANGTGTLSYGVSPTLPMGLSYSTSTGAITGTPTVTSSATTYTVTVTDTNSATATATFSLTVNAAVVATQAIASTTLTQNHAATSFTPVTGANGTGTLSYGVSPTLPTGLSYSASTGAITGTPTVTGSATTYTVTVTDANSATTTATFSLTVNAAVVATQAVASTSLTVTQLTTAFTPVTGLGGTGTLSYSVLPALPMGLTYSASGAITGTPTVTSSATTYTVTVTDANSATATATFSLTVNTPTPAIVFTVPNHTFGDAPSTVGATSNSTGAFTYSVVSGPATISGSTVTLTGAGPVVLQAAEAADANFAAGSKNATFTVAAGTPVIVFAVPNHTFGDAPFAVSATSNSTGVFTYSVVSGPATISGSTVTLTGAGPVVLQATEAASANFAAGSKNASFTVAAGTSTPTITFTVPNATFGDAPFTVSATSNSTGAFTYSVVSGPATISGSTVTLTGSGTVVLSASQAASGNFAAATVTTSVTVAIAGFTLGTGSGSSSASTTPGGTASFSLTLSPGTGATILPDAINFSVSGLPPGATATFSPATVAAGSAATAVTLSIQTNSSQALLRNENPFSGKPIAPVTMGLLLLPLLGLKPLRKRFRKLSCSSVLALTMISLGVMLLGLSGCAGGNAPATNYTVVVTATDTTASVQHTTNLTLTVQ